MTEPTMIFLKPGDGRVVYLEDGNGVLPDAGKAVPLSVYYRRRIDDGDAVACEAPAAPVTPAAPPAAAIKNQAEG